MGFFFDLLKFLLFELANFWDTLFFSPGVTAFYIERQLGEILSTDILNTIYTFVSGFAVSLIVLKMLKKGFWTYILWRDGDPDAPLQQTVINLALAVVAAISFPALYEWYAQASLWLISKLIGAISTAALAYGELDFLSMITDSFIRGICVLIYMIMLFILYLQFIKRGAEMLVLRLGFPFACLGLLDSDNGVFTSTVKVFIQVSLTTAVQLFLLNVSVVIFMSSSIGFTNLLYCIAMCQAALATPKMLQFIMLQNSGGGGGMQKVTSTVYMASMVKNLLPR